MNKNNCNGILDFGIIERGEVDHVVPKSKLAVFEINKNYCQINHVEIVMTILFYLCNITVSLILKYSKGA